MRSKYIGIIIVVLLVAAGGYFFLRTNYRASAPALTPAPTVATSPATQAPTSGVTEISVSGTEFKFSPAVINVKVGERVKITFRNIGKAPHNLALEGLDVTTKTIGTGQTDVVEFTASSAGTYNFFCSVPGHRIDGMEGRLKVE